ncbi:F-box only protein 16-like isoform X2 [Actinia tenebrosa]|uniref:F-box only protein 16-like isoform X2 n=1 Tax=Actinia tenebrosa TaxID=6105 RepID=A0A6P8I184_ACTTE|nr:F-box only protein 16-like isoform X2 [Actinia tenebrosa]
MTTRTVDFNSTAYAKTKSFIAKENVASIARAKESRKQVSVPPSGVKSSWTPQKQELNEKLFEERKELVGNWFDRWSDPQRRTVLDILVSKCKQPQLQYIFSLLDAHIPVTHVDFTRKLPRVITVYIFSYLDPRSLCRCAQVCWYWKYLSELDEIWMPKCLKFNWVLPFVPSPFEHGVWKRHYLESVKGLQYSPPSVTFQSISRETERKSQSLTNLSSTKKAMKKGSSTDLPPWKGTDNKPNEIIRKASREGPLIGCRRCHMSTHTNDDEHSHPENIKKTSTMPKTKPRIRPALASFAPEAESTSTKLDSRTGRPDWAVQSTISPVTAKRPPPPVVRPSAEALGKRREARHPPSQDLFPTQPWARPPDYDSDENSI